MKTNKLLSNSILNLAAQIIPVLCAIIFIPISIQLLGNDLFGIYSLMATIIVLFNYLNFGIAPATTKEIARSLAKNDFRETTSILFSSFTIMFGLGLTLSIIFFFFHDLLASLILSDTSLVPILSKMFFLFSFLSPLLMFVIFARSVLEAKQLFIVTAFNRALLNSVIFIAPLIVLSKYFTVIDTIYLLMMTYSISSIFLAAIIKKNFLTAHKKKHFKVLWTSSRKLLKIGIWIMLSSLAGIGLYYADRFIISAVISASAVAYYVASYDVITRLNMISGSLTAVLFPAFAHWHETQEYDKIKKTILTALKAIAFIVLLLAVLFVMFSSEILTLWINQEYSRRSSEILQLLAVGVFFNTLSVIPFRVLTAIGFHKLASMVYIIEVPFSTLFAYFMIKSYGLHGAAASYTVRTIIEFFIFYYIVFSKRVKLEYNGFFKTISYVMIIAVIFFAMAFYLSHYNITYKISIFAIWSLISGILFFLFTLNDAERETGKKFLAKIGVMK